MRVARVASGGATRVPRCCGRGAGVARGSRVPRFAHAGSGADGRRPVDWRSLQRASGLSAVLRTECLRLRVGRPSGCCDASLLVPQLTRRRDLRPSWRSRNCCASVAGARLSPRVAVSRATPSKVAGCLQLLFANKS